MMNRMLDLYSHYLSTKKKSNFNEEMMTTFYNVLNT